MNAIERMANEFAEEALWFVERGLQNKLVEVRPVMSNGDSVLFVAAWCGPRGAAYSWPDRFHHSDYHPGDLLGADVSVGHHGHRVFVRALDATKVGLLRMRAAPRGGDSETRTFMNPLDLFSACNNAVGAKVGFCVAPIPALREFGDHVARVLFRMNLLSNNALLSPLHLVREVGAICAFAAEAFVALNRWANDRVPVFESGQAEQILGMIKARERKESTQALMRMGMDIVATTSYVTDSPSVIAAKVCYLVGLDGIAHGLELDHNWQFDHSFLPLTMWSAQDVEQGIAHVLGTFIFNHPDLGRDPEGIVASYRGEQPKDDIERQDVRELVESILMDWALKSESLKRLWPAISERLLAIDQEMAAPSAAHLRRRKAYEASSAAQALA